MTTSHLQVYLNVYDLADSNSYTHSIGIGAYHSGVEIRNTEYTFSQSGIFHHKPKQVDNAKFRESIHMGETNIKTIQELNQIIQELSKDFPSKTYNVTTKNCNHFSNEFCKRLLNGKTIPNWVNRAASIGSWFSFLAPTEVSKDSQKKIYEEVDSPSKVIEKIEISSFDCLNCKNPKELFQKEVFIESKTDEQLIIFIELKNPVNLKKISFITKENDSSPKILKLYTNKLGLDFDNIEETKENEVKIVEKEKNVHMVLKSVKFKKVSNLTIFVKENYGGKRTSLTNLKIE
eukprot:gene4973-8567_t